MRKFIKFGLTKICFQSIDSEIRIAFLIILSNIINDIDHFKKVTLYLMNSLFIFLFLPEQAINSLILLS